MATTTIRAIHVGMGDVLSKTEDAVPYRVFKLEWTGSGRDARLWMEAIDRNLQHLTINLGTTDEVVRHAHGDEIYPPDPRPTSTATLNVVTGQMVIEPALDGPDGLAINGTSGEPFGEDESLDRADEMLANIGVERHGTWAEDGDSCTVTVRLA